MLSPEKKAVLVIGHPGHELRVYGWLEIMRPAVFVITDGSGRSGQSRLRSTEAILNQTSARPGSFFGSLSDSEAYAAILNRNFDTFSRLARKLASYLIDEDIDYVAGDAMEGYNPTHDVCRLLINVAVELARDATGREVANFDFPLTGAPDIAAATRPVGGIDVRLDDDAFARKMLAARSYTELNSEVEEATRQHRAEAFKLECLRPVKNGELPFAEHDQPHYEKHGEKQVAAGHYRDVLRYRQHFLPLAAALQQEIEEGL